MLNGYVKKIYYTFILDLEKSENLTEKHQLVPHSQMFLTECLEVVPIFLFRFSDFFLENKI